MSTSSQLAEVCRAGKLEPVLGLLARFAPHVADPEAAACDAASAAGSPGLGGGRGPIGFVDDEGRTALHWALANRSLELATQLLDRGATAGTADEGGSTPLMAAVAVRAPVDLITRVLKAGPEEYDAPWASLAPAVQSSIMERLYFEATLAQEEAAAAAAGAAGEPAPTAEEATVSSAAMGQPGTIVADAAFGTAGPGSAGGSNAPPPVSVPAPSVARRRWVDRGDEIGNTALLLAASQGTEPAVAALLAAGADPFVANRRGLTALHRAVPRGSAAVIEAVVAAARISAAAEAERRAAAIGAAEKRRPGFDAAATTAATTAAPAQSLFGGPTSTTLSGHSAVGTGAVGGHSSAAVAAKREGQRAVRRFVSAADGRGDTALHHCAMENNKELGELLLRLGANREARNRDGMQFWQL